MTTAKKRLASKGKLATHSEIRKKFPGNEVRIRSIRAQMDAEIATYPLAEMRKALRLTQIALAEDIGIDQSNVSRIERGKLSKTEIATLQKYIEALGGTLEINARFGNKVHSITNSGLLSAEANW